MGKRGRPSTKGGVVLALCALFLAYMAVWMMIHPEPDNIAGDVILDVALVSVAVWVGRHTIRRWREIRANARGACPLVRRPADLRLPSPIHVRPRRPIYVRPTGPRGTREDARCVSARRRPSYASDSSVRPGTALKIVSLETSGIPRRIAVAAIQRSALCSRCARA